MVYRKGSIRFALLATALAFSLPAAALDQKKEAASKTPEAYASEVSQFCANNLASANTAKINWQKSKLLELENRINQRIADLETRKTQLIDLLKKYEEANKTASDAVIAIFAHMKPDAAAAQLSAMDESTAASVIAKLPSRAAGTILNEMEPSRAAQLTRAMLAPGFGSDAKKS